MKRRAFEKTVNIKDEKTDNSQSFQAAEVIMTIFFIIKHEKKFEPKEKIKNYDFSVP